ncbi:hypothetical protein MTR_1g029590 [Medicago truncatula]|uniref:Transmembrane protein n=1 Tax=Medicago truncatula TaxID=3880 RepID=A0A072VFC4_MEDTR|nr:hypothetical protein MTR_1g029590 [Medicago truncatula]
MIVSWRHQCLLLVLVTFIVLSKGSRLLKDQYWEQMLPKKLPSPSSSPSRGTNYVLTTLKTDHNILPTSDGKEDSMIISCVNFEDNNDIPQPE